ncbi:MAG TPA: hypothetical protein PLQ19_04235 [Aeromicrobium sp.]|nr:hypothetical protein [Aeromicrobium sp.]
MTESSKSRKKVVRVDTGATDASGGSANPPAGPTWTATPEAKGQALKLRLIAGGLWAVAIVGQLFGIFYVLRQDPIKLWLLILIFVVVGALAMGGSYLWKRANRLDPASEADKVRFFVQNQLGAIITIVAFLPLIILVLTSKDLDGKQKAIAGTIGVLIMAGAALYGADFDPPSQEQYTSETNEVVAITGQDLVFWTKSGKVFHLCEDVSAVNLESKDNTIYSGTVAEAHAAGKDRLTKQFESEKRQCGFADSTSTPSPTATADTAGE